MLGFSPSVPACFFLCIRLENSFTPYSSLQVPIFARSPSYSLFHQPSIPPIRRCERDYYKTWRSRMNNNTKVCIQCQYLHSAQNDHPYSCCNKVSRQRQLKGEKVWPIVLAGVSLPGHGRLAAGSESTVAGLGGWPVTLYPHPSCRA